MLTVLKSLVSLTGRVTTRNPTRGLLRTDRRINHESIDYAVCIDIECTCDSPVQMDPMEIIEIACVKVDLRSSDVSKRKIGQGDLSNQSPIFQSYVKPVINPTLTLFCQELTGISQSIVDNSESFDVVFDRMMSWLEAVGLIDANYERTKKFAFATCGNFDMNLLSPLINDCKFTKNNLELPVYFREWINVKKTFVNHKKEWPRGLYHMLEILGEEPIGRLHSAEDDCKNLAKIVECLHAEGCKLYATNRVL